MGTEVEEGHAGSLGGNKVGRDLELSGKAVWDPGSSTGDCSSL